MAATFTLTLADRVSGSAAKAGVAVDKVTAALDKLKEADQSAKAMSAAKEVFAATQPKAQGLGAAMDVLGGKAKSFVSGMSPASGVLGSVSEALGALGPKGRIVAVVLAVLTVAITATVGAMLRMARAAIDIVEQKQALIHTFDALGDGAASGAETLAVVEKLSAQLPFVTSKIGAWAKSLMGAGIQGAELERGIHAIAAATAIMGDSGGAAAEGLIKRFATAADIGEKIKLDRRLLSQLGAAGVSATALAAQLGVPVEKLGSMSLEAGKLGDAMQSALAQSGGKAIQNMTTDVSVLKAKLSEGWDSLFEGLSDAVGPFMTAIRDLFSEFFKGSTTMKAGQSAVTAGFTLIFNAATTAVRAIHHGFLVAQVAALKVAIAIAPVVNWLRAVASNATVLRGLGVALAVLALPFVIIGIAIMIALLPLAILIGLFVAVAVVIGLVVSAVLWVAGAIWDFVSSAGEAIGGWVSSAASAAGDFVSGLVDGITGGIGRVIGAVKGLASSAVGALMGALKARSPSRLTMGIGDDVFAEGMVEGVDDGAARVSAAAGRLGKDAAAEIAVGADGPAGGGGARGAPGGRGGLTVTFADGAIRIDGAGKSALEITEEMLASVLERLAASQGLAPRPA